MTWFAASVIIGIRRIDMPNGPTLAYENIILIEADTPDEALTKAKEYGGAEVSVDDGFTIDDKPAIKSLVGVRKLINVSNPYPLDLDKDRPTTGTEITYSLFEVENSEDLAKLAKGEEVALRYVE